MPTSARAGAGQPSLLLLNRRDNGLRLELWELAEGLGLQALRQRNAAIDADQARWASHRAQDVRCLPQQQVLVSLYYARPSARHGLYVYDRRDNRFQRLSERIEADPYGGLPQRYVDVLAAGPEAALVLFHTDADRLAAEVYVNRHDHLVLFSRRHPKGLALLTLGVDKGNVRRWAMQGSVLHLETTDPREAKRPLNFNWSLDLASVL